MATLNRAPHEFLCDAIHGQKRVRFQYQGGSRVVEPHLLGTTHQGKQVLRAFQIKGYSHSHRPHHWKLFDVSKIEGLEILDEEFHGPRPGYTGEQGNLARIDCKVEEANPTPEQRRRLSERKRHPPFWAKAEEEYLLHKDQIEAEKANRARFAVAADKPLPTEEEHLKTLEKAETQPRPFWADAEEEYLRNRAMAEERARRNQLLDDREARLRKRERELARRERELAVREQALNHAPRAMGSQSETEPFQEP